MTDTDLAVYPYTIVLQYPDFMDGGTFIAHPVAVSEEAAAEEARQDMADANPGAFEEVDDLQDLIAIIAVFPGHHPDIYDGTY